MKVNIADLNGNFCPVADNLIKFELEGEGEILAVGNGMRVMKILMK